MFNVIQSVLSFFFGTADAEDHKANEREAFYDAHQQKIDAHNRELDMLDKLAQAKNKLAELKEEQKVLDEKLASLRCEIIVTSTLAEELEQTGQKTEQKLNRFIAIERSNKADLN